MAEINGYLLTKEEEKECVKLIEKLREEKVFTVDFSGSVRIKAKTPDQANDIFNEWACDLQDITSTEWYGAIKQYPCFNIDGIEEE